MALTTTIRTRAPNVIVLWLVAATLLAALAGLATPARGANCSSTGPPTTGDWTVSDLEVCDGIVVMDGNLTVQGPNGNLMIRNGGLKFIEDTTHRYTLTVEAGAVLNLTGSTVWTETNQINPYLMLTVDISGSFSMVGSTLAFPGFFNSNPDSSVLLYQGSVITRSTANLGAVFSGGAVDDNDDAPALTFNAGAGQVALYSSRVENLYQNAALGGPDPRTDIRLLGTTTLTAVDTFLAIDFFNDTTKHNRLDLQGTSNAYLYGVTVDYTDRPGAQDQYVPAIVTAAGARADLYRWADVRVVDANSVPVPVATVTANFAGSMTGPATFRDNLGLPTPPGPILAYLGKSVAPPWNETGADGVAHMPLLSDYIDTTTLPNSRFVGQFTLSATASGHTGTGSLTFAAYPAMDVGDTSSSVLITLPPPGFANPPDLTPMQPTFTPATPKEGQTVTIRVPVENLGAGGAGNVLVRISDGVNLLGDITIPSLSPFPQAGYIQNVTTTLAGAAAGQHVIRVFVDPNNVIYEGPVGSVQETNNLRGFPLNVVPLGPDLSVTVSFSPDPGFLNNPVALQANVVNVGDRNATNVQVNFYVQNDRPTTGSIPTGSAFLPAVNISATATLSWTPTSLGDFSVWAWVDPTNQIPELAPYREDNNLNNATLRVNPAPDIVTFPWDLSMTDPFPRVGQAVTIEAVVRNAGQAPTGGFQVDFTKDGATVGTRNNFTGLAPGEKWSTSIGASAFATCGAHTIGIAVDSTNAVVEGSFYEANNNVTTTVQAYPNQFITWAGGTITADQALSSSLEITGAVTISNARITILQDQDPCGRYYVKVLGGGSLTLTNAQITSNWPLVVFVAPNGALTAVNTTFSLDNQGRGALHSKGTLSLTRSTVFGDVTAKGTSATLLGNTYRGSLVHVDTTSTTRLWDGSFPGVTTIHLATDRPSPPLKTTPDFDIRNVTFDSGLTAQLVFSGTQWIALTSISLTKGGDWWTGMLTQSSHITRYWWLTVETVDGTGSRFSDPTTSVGLERFDSAGPTPGWRPAPVCVAGDCYFSDAQTPSGRTCSSAITAWPVGAPCGVLLYRAASEERWSPSSPTPPSVRATYRANGTANIQGPRSSDTPAPTALVIADSTIILTFSALTPDVTITAMAFNGANGPNVDSQPLGVALTLQATVQNLGQITVSGVVVYWYSVDVDANPRDGLMDNPPAVYAGFLIGQAGPQDVTAGGFVNFTASWTPPGTSESSGPISAVVDPLTTITELNERNNTAARVLNLFAWPDLHLSSDPVGPTTPSIPVVNNDISFGVTVLNEGTNNAGDAPFAGAAISLTLNGTGVGTTATVFVAKGATVTATLTWRPTSAGPQIILIRITAGGGTFRNVDFDLADNTGNHTFDVRPQPDLTIAQRGPPPSPYRDSTFDVNVTVDNTGQIAVTGVVIAIWDEADASQTWLGALYDQTIAGPTNLKVPAKTGLTTLGTHNLKVMVDANDTVVERFETNNIATISVNVSAPKGSVVLATPSPTDSYKPDDTIFISGKVVQTDGAPIGGVQITALLLDSSFVQVPGAQASNVSASGSGVYIMSLTVPSNLPDGTYTLRIDAADISITDVDQAISIRMPVTFFNIPFLGLPLWIWLIVIIGAAVAIGGGTAYVKFVGLGKLVECGECGSFIPEDSTKCPKCGVEFEKDMAKCSNCQAWIPVDVKQCPECGVEFATGEVEMADYEAQMRRQYDDVKRKFREEASRELGHTLSDKEFEDWWRTQPTFVTFEEWLREEEDMRRMGSKPCPVCNTLNSVTATVCHKCGTLLKEEPRKKGGAPPTPQSAARPATPGAGPAARPALTEEAAEEAGPGMPSEAIPKKVIKKPVMGAPVVQKKVIKRPLEEEKKEGEGGDGTGGEEEQI